MSTITNSGGHLTYPNLPVFQANAVNTISLTSSFVEQANVYTEVEINRGNHYNATTGRFTAPVAGIYQFGVASIGGNANVVFRWRFYKNGVNTEFELRLDGGATGSEYQPNGSMEVYLELAADDYVSVYARSDDGSDAFGDALNKYSYFNGRFIG